MSRPAGFAVFLTCAATLAVPAARAQTVEARLADLRLATAVRLALVRDAETRGLDVDVAAQNGTVRLTPPSADALRVARAVAGVQSVDGDASPAGRPRTDRSEAPPGEGRAAESVPASTAETPRASPWGAAPRAEAPRAETPSAPAGPAVHVVGRGETLFSLARRYGTTVDALRRLNGLAGTAGIEIGQRLRLR